jgi:hypothetical protein
MSPDPLHGEELPELPEAADLHELPAEPVRPAAGPSALAAGERPPLRVLDPAPLHLRRAALIVVAGSLLPWMPGKFEQAGQLWWLTTLLAKGLVLAAAWTWLQQVLHNFGPPLSGLLGKLAALVLVPKKKEEPEDERKRRAKPRPTGPASLEHPFPTGLHALSFVLIAAGLVLAFGDPRRGLIGSNGLPELAMLGWAAFTYVNIASYERWGSFNPLFSLLFLGMLFAGAAAVIGVFTGDAGGPQKIMGLLGGGAVGAGGGLAVFTIVEAMLQAKKEGDRKKAEALEARKAARKKRE